MGIFRKDKPQQREAEVQPGTASMSSGRRLRSSLSVTECADTLQQVFGAYRARRYPELPPLVPAGTVWGAAEFAPSLVLSGVDAADNFLLITLADTGMGTEAGIFPLGTGEARLNLSVVGHWKQRDKSLTSVGTWSPDAVRLAPPPVSDALIQSTLQAAGYPVTAANQERIAKQFTVMFLIKCQGFVETREGARGADRFADHHKKAADWNSPTGPLRSALQLLAEWNTGVLPYIQDLPPRCRAILLENVGEQGTFWSELEH